MKVVGILVCNSQEVLEHKQNDGKKSDKRYCHWEMRRFPKQLTNIEEQETCIGTGVVSEPAKAPNTYWIYDEEDILFSDIRVRLYFAVQGMVRGYFVCQARGIRNNCDELRFYSESWTSINPIAVKPSQGWRYFNHEKE